MQNINENPAVAWWQKDNQHCELLVNIDEQQCTEEEAGWQAFYQVSKLYNLPKFPADINKLEGEEKEDGAVFGEIEEEEEVEQRSVFEEIALIRYLFPDDEYRGIVLFALHNVYHRSFMPYDEVAALHFGSHDEIPENYFLYFFGKNVDATVKLDIGDQSWVEAGAVFMQKVFRETYD